MIVHKIVLWPQTVHMYSKFIVVATNRVHCSGFIRVATNRVHCSEFIGVARNSTCVLPIRSSGVATNSTCVTHEVLGGAVSE